MGLPLIELLKDRETSRGEEAHEVLTCLFKARLLVRRLAQWNDEAVPDKEEVRFGLEPYCTRHESCDNPSEHPARYGCIATSEK